jgi:flagellar biosynthesis protein FliQ
MDTAEIVRMSREALVMVLVLGGPTLLASVIIGTVVALFQAVTQVHEATLTFLPKLILVGLVLAITGGWMLELTVSYTQRSFSNISRIGEER